MDQHIEELFPFYALEAVSDEERAQVEAYLAAHPEARRQVEELKQAASVLPQSIQPVEPAPRTREALMRRVTADAEARARIAKREQPAGPRLTGFGSLFRTISFAGAALAVLWAIYMNVQVVQLRNEISALKEALVAQSNSLQEIATRLEQTNPSRVITVSLEGTSVQPQAQGQLIADPQGRSAVLVISGLSPLEPGRTYQVWWIEGETPVSAGLLAVDEKGQGVLILNSEQAVGSFDALGISIEPEGGSLQPSGDIVVLSNL